MSGIEIIQEVSEEYLGSSSDEDTCKILEYNSTQNIDENDKETIDDLEEFIDKCVQKNLSIKKPILEETEEIKQENVDLKKTVYCENPLVFTIDNYLTDEECDHFINISKDKMQRAVVSSDKKGYVSTGRTGLNHWLDHNQDETTTRVGERIAKEVGHPLINSEKYQIIYYGETQEYRQHYDSWEHDYSEKSLRCMKYGGARLLTALCYLNDVEEGGGTCFPKLDVVIKAKKGRIVCFENTHKDSHVKHKLAEHAGMPVIKGEKYAFNLWFRECPRSVLYKDFNPEYYKKGEPIIRKRIEDNLKREKNSHTLGKINKTHPLIMNYLLKDNVSSDAKFLDNPIYNLRKVENFINDDLHEKIMNNTSFNDKTKRSSCWVKKSTVPNFTQKLEQLLGIPSEFYENYNAIQYKPNESHNNFLDAYDLTSDRGMKYCSTLGQRVYTVVLFLTKNIEYKMTKIHQKYVSHGDDILIYKNTEEKCNQRNSIYTHSVLNKSDDLGIILNIYIREKTSNNKNIFDNEKFTILLENNEIKEIDPKEMTSNKMKINNAKETEENIKLEIKETEDYQETYDKLFTDFKSGKINRSWRNKSLTFTHKLPIDTFRNFLNDIDVEKSKYENRSLINPELLEQDYTFDEYHPLALDNILRPGVIDIFRDLYKAAIKNDVFPLGDKQSQRYKSHNESVARVLHYEILPIIEKITREKVCPTYTYTSFYVKGADLPSHTDRKECQYTVSFIIDKPAGSTWNIYVDMKNQAMKNIGRCSPISEKKDCVPVDCDANGLMIFCGEDHCHFREKLEHDYYNILLLHYRRID